MSESNKQKPVFKVKVGNIEGAVWQQSGEKGNFLTINTARNYLDEKDKTGGKNGTWKKTNSLRVNDIPAQQLVLQKCYEYCKLERKYDAED